jgi:hypothetical protein
MICPGFRKRDWRFSCSSQAFYSGKKVLGQVMANGQAVLTMATLMLRNHKIEALFEGGTSFTASISSVIDHKVQRK